MPDFPGRAFLLAFLVSLLVTTTAVSQTGLGDPILLSGSERMEFNRPESWAMKYFTSVSMMSGIGTTETTRPGSIHLSFEGGFVPSLGEEKRRVGFIGSKVEDLNRTNVFARLRGAVGLPRRYVLEVGVTPPVEVDGVTPELFNLALARPLVESSSWRVGLRLHGQVGTIAGDLTCPAELAGVADSRLNPDECLVPSNDEVTQNYVGLEMSVARRLESTRWSPHVAASINYLDLEFQVDARYSAFLDRVRLLTAGYTYYVATGVSYRMNDKLTLGGEVFYSPLSVVRSAQVGSTNDELLTARFLARYRLH